MFRCNRLLESSPRVFRSPWSRRGTPAPLKAAAGAASGWPESIARWKAARAPFTSPISSSRTPSLKAASGAASGWPESIACWKAAALRALRITLVTEQGTQTDQRRWRRIRMARINRALESSPRAVEITLVTEQDA